MKKTPIVIAIILVLVIIFAISLKGCFNSNDNGNDIGVTLQTTTLTAEEKSEIVLTAKMFNGMLDAMKAEANTEGMKKFFSGETVTYAENDDTSIYNALVYMERWYEVRLGLQIEEHLTISERAQQLRASWELVKSYHIVDKVTPINIYDDETGKGSSGGSSSGNGYIGGDNKKPSTTKKPNTTVKPTQGSTSSKDDVNINVTIPDINLNIPDININWPNFPDFDFDFETKDPEPNPGTQVTDPNPDDGQDGNSYDDPPPADGYQNEVGSGSADPDPGCGQTGNADPDPAPGAGYQVKA